MVSGGNTLSKAERLSGKKAIGALLADGKWGAAGHFRYCWLAAGIPARLSASGKGPGLDPQGAEDPGIAPPKADTPAANPARIMIAVPKRYFKRAVKRNLLKRRIREAYRVRKIEGVDILFQYNSAELADFAAISADVQNILNTIQQQNNNQQ